MSDSESVIDESDERKSKTKGKKVVLAQPLPTDRISFDKQLQLLEAYAVASNKGNSPVGAETVAPLVQMHPSTASLANAFFVKMGFLQRSGRLLLPSKEVLDYKLATEWNRETAGEKLLPILQQSWCTTALARLQLGPMPKDEVISALAQGANAPPSHRQQILNMISFLTASNFMREDGENYVYISPDIKALDSQSSKRENKEAEPNQSEDNFETISIKFGSAVVAILKLSAGMDADALNFVWKKLDNEVKSKQQQLKGAATDTEHEENNGGDEL